MMKPVFTPTPFRDAILDLSHGLSGSLECAAGKYKVSLLVKY